MRVPAQEECAGLVIGIVAAAAKHSTKRLPPFSALLGNVILAGGGFLVGHAIYRYKEDRVKRREVWIWDYVNKHPEDFPELKGENVIRYKDRFDKWTPIR